MFRSYRFFLFLTISLSFFFPNACLSGNKISDRDYFLHLQKTEKILSAKELYELARLYIYGIGTEKNLQKAFPILEQSADLGSSNALNMLGFLYREGLGVKKNPQRALDYFYAAAQKNNMLAQYNLGMYYYTGRVDNSRAKSRIVDKNYEKAVYWFEIAANKGYAYAQARLGVCYYNREGFAKVDYIKAAHLFHLSANQGNILGTHYLAKCYEHGNGVDQNYKQAFDLYYQASKLNGTRFPYLITLTNMIPHQFYILLLTVAILIGLRYPWATPMPFVTSYRGKQAYFLGRLSIPVLLASFLAILLIGITGLSNEDKLVSYGIIHAFFYAFCSVKMQKIEMHSKIYKRKTKHKHTSPEDDLYSMLSAFMRFLKNCTNRNNK